MARNKAHPGVSLFNRRRRGTSHLCARWRDPVTGKAHTVDLVLMGMGTKVACRPWAVRLSNELAVSAKAHKAVDGGAVTPDAAWVSFVADRRREHGEESAHRLEAYESKRWQPFMRELGLRTVAEITAAACRKFRESLDDLTPPTRNHHLECGRAYMNWCRRRRITSLSAEDISEAFRKFRVERTLPRVPKREELVRLIAAAVEHDTARFHAGRASKDRYSKQPNGPATGAPRFAAVAPFFFLSMLTGMRASEAFTLKWEDVDVERGEIRVRHTKTRVDRVIPLHDSPALLRLLRALRQVYSNTTHVVGDGAKPGTPRAMQSRVWIRLFESAGVEQDRNLLRRAAASAVASCGKYNEFLLQMRFGHSTEVANAHYRRAQFGAVMAGDTLEEWLGVKAEVAAAFDTLGW
jgi:integrase